MATSKTLNPQLPSYIFVLDSVIEVGWFDYNHLNRYTVVM